MSRVPRDEIILAGADGTDQQSRQELTADSLQHSVQIAFAGHNRAEDLGDPESIFSQLSDTFTLLRTAGVSEARLLTGLASGSDELAAAAWRQAGLGPIHAVLPYLDFELNGRIGPDGLAEDATWLDGAAAEAAGRNAHLKQTRMIVEAADLVVVVWNGEPARGAGGTADAVLSALQLGLPVLWLRPGDRHGPRLIRPESLPADFHFPEFQEALQEGHLRHVQDATVETLRDALARAKSPPLPTSKPLGRWRAAWDGLMHSSLWRTHKTFRDMLGGHAKVDVAPVSPPASLEAQPGFQVLSGAYAACDHVANRLSAVHRSEQVLLAFAMVIAALVGSAWTIWPEVKVVAVWVELSLSVAGLLVWAVASDAHQHERWGEFRFLAERLRLERASWAIGIGMPRGGGEAGAWRQVRRDAGLPHGRFDPDRASAWGAWALHELVQGQAAYHRAVSTRDARFAHRIQRFESFTFLWFFVIFSFYLASYSTGRGHWLPEWFSGVVSMTGAVIPALAAAAMALESKLELEEQSERGRRIAATLDRLARRLVEDSSFEAMQNVAREAVALHVAESGQWQEGVSRRRLFRA